MNFNLVGNNILKLETVQSTNDYVKEFYENDINNRGLVVTTENQMAGKGQRGNKWESEKSMNLIFSILLFPDFLKVSERYYLTMISSLAIRNIFNHLIPTEVKWPNDLYVNYKKIGGILIENSFEGNIIKSSIIGIGLNINQLNFSKITNATSLKLETQKHYDLDILLDQILKQFNKLYFLLMQKKFNLIQSLYLDSLLNYNILASYYNNLTKQYFSGILKNVQADGKAVFENTLEGKTQIFDIKELSFVF